MRSILKFKRKNGAYKYTNSSRQWQDSNGVHYVHYPFMIYKDGYDKRWKLTHLSSGALVCTTVNLYNAKYIATRLFPLPQCLLPDSTLVSRMSEEQRRFCTDIITRYRDEGKGNIEKLDKNCPFSI